MGRMLECREAMDGQERPAYARGERVWQVLAIGDVQCDVQSRIGAGT
jgi:hypothetical protein